MLFPNFTKKVPIIDVNIHAPPIDRGYIIILMSPGKNIDDKTIVATIVTAYVSNKSAAIPAQSPTLSPTLSAITAGFLGSSSGIPASTLPTRSAPTSAPFVNIPPPSLANIEINDAPKPSATSALTISLSSTLKLNNK